MKVDLNQLSVQAIIGIKPNKVHQYIVHHLQKIQISMMVIMYIYHIAVVMFMLEQEQQILIHQPGEWGFYFSGHLIITNIIEYLIDNYSMNKAENVLISGCSAGGIGTFGNTDWIYHKLLAYNPNIRYKAAPVVGWFYAGNCTDEQSPGF